MLSILLLGDAAFTGNAALTLSAAVTDDLFRPVWREETPVYIGAADGLVLSEGAAFGLVDGINRAFFHTRPTHRAVCKGITVRPWVGQKFCRCDHTTETARHSLFSDQSLGKTEGTEPRRISRMALWKSIELGCTYSQFERIKRLLEEHEAVIENTDFGADIVFSALLREDMVEAFGKALTELSASTCEYLECGESFRGVRVK